jgi:hypothetical protein
LSPAVSEWGRTMADVGKTNIVVMWTVGPDGVAEGDRIFESHVSWMTGPGRRHSSAVLQDLEGPGAVESRGPQLRPDR